MNRDDLRNQLHAYRDGELSLEESRALEEALARDPKLREEWEELEALDEILDHHPTIEPAGDFVTRVLIRAQAPRARPWWQRYRWAAAAVAAVLIGFLFLPSGRDPAAAGEVSRPQIADYAVLVPPRGPDVSDQELRTQVETIELILDQYLAN